MLNYLLTTQPQTIIAASDNTNVAVINIVLTNLNSLPAKVQIYAVPNGKSLPTYDENGKLTGGNPETLLANLTLESDETIFFSTEKFLLHPGDAIYAKVLTDTDQVACHVVYEVY